MFSSKSSLQLAITRQNFHLGAVAMGANQSSTSDASATISSVPSGSNGDTHNANRSDLLKDDVTGKCKVLQTPILMDEDGGDGDDGSKGSEKSSFPTPTGKEYDLMDRIAADLPAVIDDESRQQVEDYIEACDNGKGPMVACFSMAEYVSLFLRKHKDATMLYENTCFR